MDGSSQTPTKDPRRGLRLTSPARLIDSVLPWPIGVFMLHKVSHRTDSLGLEFTSNGGALRKDNLHVQPSRETGCSPPFVDDGPGLPIHFDTDSRVPVVLQSAVSAFERWERVQAMNLNSTKQLDPRGEEEERRSKNSIHHSLL